jgi:hypothetical protein
MPEMTSRARMDEIGSLAGEALENLYTAVAREPPRALRVYHEDDALLLLLRFGPPLRSDAAAEHCEAPIDTSFMAMPDMVAEVLRQAAGFTLVPGSVSICAERGLAVFAFSVLGEDDGLDGEDPIAGDPFWSNSFDGGLVLAT